ncbi:MAG: type II/IV secretion system protein [Candidatus Wildermuthbacteria bacterium]|nr:type II/IV secretion system protein [Candidatus Wildermuthbacteria bacterium]
MEAKEQNKKEEEVILENNALEEGLLFNLKSEDLKVPLKEVLPEEVPLKVLELIPEDSARFYKMIPLAKKEDVLEVGMVYPEDFRAQDALKFLARQNGFSYSVALIAISTFRALMKQYQGSKGGVKKALEELEQHIQVEAVRGKGETLTQRVSEDAPITKMVAVILRNAVEGGASDIHIEPTREKLMVRFRFLGELHPSLLLPMSAHQAVVARIKILANMKLDESRLPQDGRFSTPIDNRTVDFRVATLPTPFGEKVAIRVLDTTLGLKGLEGLGLEGRNLLKIQEAIKKPYGLILVTGPTGSGKSTTLYSILSSLNREGENIVSLEDPVEYFIEGINQSQVRPELGYDFASGLRQILRQDPDVIMVGEVRDAETASLIIHAALTGHVVLSTLHTNNALGVIPRLIDMGIERYLLAPTLSVALSQRLVRKLCPACRKKTESPDALKNMVAKEIESAPSDFQKAAGAYISASKAMTVYAPKGCKECGGSGYAGRIGIFEVLEMTDELGKLIYGDISETSLRKETKRQGMVSMRQDGIVKALEGVTTLEEVLRVTTETDDN